ncbi:MAG: hypothetical protein ACRD96_15045, partial [Bryobacteraceae bacterium]
LACMAYVTLIWWKSSMSPLDAAMLIAIYVVYLLVLGRMPPQDQEGIEELDRIPRAVVAARAPVRVATIVALFAGGGWLIYYAAEPFLGSLLAVSTAIGVPAFVFVQWVAPFVSEFPEKVSAFYWARTIEKAPMALMNMVSSNINQWTLLTAMLVIVYSMSRGEPSVIHLDANQRLEILMTLGQSLVGALFLVNMRLAWWEASALFGLWALQFAFSPVQGALAGRVHEWVTYAYLVWAAIEIVRICLGRRQAAAFQQFGVMWRRHVRPAR